jgi:hypothetical protein
VNLTLAVVAQKDARTVGSLPQVADAAKLDDWVRTQLRIPLLAIESLYILAA